MQSTSCQTNNHFVYYMQATALHPTVLKPEVMVISLCWYVSNNIIQTPFIWIPWLTEPPNVSL